MQYSFSLQSYNFSSIISNIFLQVSLSLCAVPKLHTTSERLGATARIRKISCIFRSCRLYHLLLIISFMSTMPKLPVAEVDCACFRDIRSLTLIGNHGKCKRFLRWPGANRQNLPHKKNIRKN